MDISPAIRAVGELPTWILITIFIFFGVIFFIFFILVLWNGINLKIIKFDGLKKINESIDSTKTTILKTKDLRGIIDDIDKETKSDIIDGLYSLLSLLGDSSERCAFIDDSIKNEIRIIFKNYILKNHIIQKCYPEFIESEKKLLFSKIIEEYKIMTIKMKAANCPGATPLPSVADAEKIFIKFIEDFFSIIKKSLIIGCEKKIKIYKAKREIVGDQWVVHEFIDIPIQKNEHYIKKLKE